MNILFYCQKSDEKTLLYAQKLFSVLKEKGVKIFLPITWKGRELCFGDYPYCIDSQCIIAHKINKVITFGGDGTILSAVEFLRENQLPIVGINSGRLGFLALFTQDLIFDQMDQIVGKKLQKSERSLIKVHTQHTQIDFPYALNEVVVSRNHTAGMVVVETFLNEEYLNKFWADGLIFSTPTGSTGYSMSCGGPIISPHSQNWILTPIAPHNLSVRPLVVEDSSCIRIKVQGRSSHYALSLDSRVYTLPMEEEIGIEKSKFSVQLLVPSDYNYYKIINEKLLWGKDFRN